MKFLLLATLFLTLAGCSTKVEVMKEKVTPNVSFNDVWNQVSSNPLKELPQNEVSYFKLSRSGENFILKDAQRTLSDHSDLLEPFEKLAHPNGVCFKGVWKITKDSVYGGYFKKGSEALIIARASTAMSNVKSGGTRAFGFAGKLFPTTNPQKTNDEPSANFFLIEDLGGTDAEYYRDVELTNEPTVSLTYEAIQNALYALKVSSAFSDADKNPTIRQLYEISYLGESEGANVVTPKWMKIEIADAKTRNKKDFRDELTLGENQELLFNVSVASKTTNEKREWLEIGEIRLDASVVSNSCDARLHFHHPKWRDDLNHGAE